MKDTISISVTQTYEVPNAENCSGCRHKNASVWCTLFKKVIRLDRDYRNRVPVDECLKARKAAGRKKAGRKK